MHAQTTPAAGSLLASLIAPLSPEEFFSRYYEQDWYVTAEPVAAVADLISIDRIDEIISDSELPPSSLSMAQSGQGLAQEEYTHPNGAIDRGAVLDNFRNGVTIVLPQMHFADGKLYKFCLGLERDFGARIQTNIYLTPDSSQGFGIHYDDHDVLVLQVSGRKKWEIYGQRDGLPFRGEKFRKDHDDPGELKAEFVLEPGQCLYVPRGMAHRATNEGAEPSLHITVGILVQTWAEFLLEAVAEVTLRSPDMRKSLPRSLFFDPAARAENAATFQHLMNELARKASFDATLAVFGSNFVMAQGPRVRGALNALASGIADTDRLTLRESILYSIDLDGEEPQLTIADTAVALKPDLAPQLQAQLAAGSVCMADFTVEDAADLRDTVETLVAYGLLERV
jgi:bifunctional lysine-specific demethylase and histidyl-hydroxylase NO66